MGKYDASRQVLQNPLGLQVQTPFLGDMNMTGAAFIGPESTEKRCVVYLNGLVSAHICTHFVIGIFNQCSLVLYIYVYIYIHSVYHGNI